MAIAIGLMLKSYLSILHLYQQKISQLLQYKFCINNTKEHTILLCISTTFTVSLQGLFQGEVYAPCSFQRIRNTFHTKVPIEKEYLSLWINCPYSYKHPLVLRAILLLNCYGLICIELPIRIFRHGDRHYLQCSTLIAAKSGPLNTWQFK